MDDVAVFWDYENIRAIAKGINVPLAESLITYSKSIGHPRLKKVYSNWRSTSDTVIQALYSLGFEAIQVSMGKQNSVDVKLTVDCMSAIKDIPTITRVIIVTGDKDYIPLVNWLKERRKKVIIVGQSDIISEHLMLSADEFISLKELPDDSTQEESLFILTNISFADAIDCMVKAISTARDRGKSTRFETVDTTMRVDPTYKYAGANSVQKNNDETFKSFSQFVEAAEEMERVKTETIEGFKEIFLPEEDPIRESEFIPVEKDEIDRDQWNIILDQVEKAFTEVDTEHNMYGRFYILFKYIRSSKKDGLLPHTNNTLKNALSKLVDIGLLVKQPNESYRLVENYESSRESFLEKILSE